LFPITKKTRNVNWESNRGQKGILPAVEVCHTTSMKRKGKTWGDEGFSASIREGGGETSLVGNAFAFKKAPKVLAYHKPGKRWYDQTGMGERS